MKKPVHNQEIRRAGKRWLFQILTDDLHGLPQSVAITQQHRKQRFQQTITFPIDTLPSLISHLRRAQQDARLGKRVQFPDAA